MRYQKLFEIVRDLQPVHCVEIGTWTGKRAAEWMGVSNCFYTGFDLFEEGSTENDEAELNVKHHTEMCEVGKSLEVAGSGRFKLIRGNTRETLPKMVVSSEESEDDFHMFPFDFAFIDGGHSVETIRNDFDWVYKNIDEGGVIILDDHYTPEMEDFGCNFLEDKGEVIKGTDKFVHGTVRLLRVEKNG